MDLERTYALDPTTQVLIADLGISLPRVLRRAGLPGDLLTRGPARLTPPRYFAFWQALDDEVGDPLLPLAIARALTAEAFHPVIFAALCSRNLEQAALRVAQFKALLGPVDLDVSTGPAGLTLQFAWSAHLRPPPLLSLVELLFPVSIGRIGTRSRIQPQRITTPTPPPQSDPYRDHLGVAISTAAAWSISFAASDAARPFLTANVGMWQIFEPELKRRLDQLDGDASIADRVRSVLIEQLPAGRATVETVAEALAMSSRTLQRRLADAGTTFTALVRQTREALAGQYLRQPDLGNTEIALLLGYDDTGSFHRAFKEWTGLTPEAHRRRTTRSAAAAPSTASQERLQP